MEQFKFIVLFFIINVFLIYPKGTFSQIKPDILNDLPSQIGIDGKTIYPDLRIDKSFLPDVKLIYSYDDSCRLQGVCYDRSSSLICNDFIYENDKIVKIESDNFYVEYDYDFKDRVISESGSSSSFTGGRSYSYKIRYDSLDREIFSSQSSGFSGGAATGGNSISKKYTYDSLGRMTEFQEEFSTFDNISGSQKYIENKTYLYADELLIQSVFTRIDERYYYYPYFSIDTVYSIHDYVYQDSVLSKLYISDEIGPIYLFEYSISDSLEESLIYEFVENDWIIKEKEIKKFDNEFLIENIKFSYADSDFHEYSREVFLYDIRDRLTERKFYRNTELNEIEEYIYNSNSQILEYNNIEFEDGQEEEQNLTLNEYDSSFRNIKTSIFKYKNGVLTARTITECEYDIDGVLLNKRRNGILQEEYFYSDCGALTQVSNHEELGKLKVYPNPTLNELNVEIINENFVDKFIVYDINGNAILREAFSPNFLQKIDLRNLESGTYFFVAIENEKIVYSQTFVKI